jgi:hypothetical protein
MFYLIFRDQMSENIQLYETVLLPMRVVIHFREKG